MCWREVCIEGEGEKGYTYGGVIYTSMIVGFRRARQGEVALFSRRSRNSLYSSGLARIKVDLDRSPLLCTQMDDG